MQGREEAGDLGLEEPDSLAEDGRPVLFRLEGLLGRSQLFLQQFFFFKIVSYGQIRASRYKILN